MIWFPRFREEKRMDWDLKCKMLSMPERYTSEKITCIPPYRENYSTICSGGKAIFQNTFPNITKMRNITLPPWGKTSIVMTGLSKGGNVYDAYRHAAGAESFLLEQQQY